MAAPRRKAGAMMTNMMAPTYRPIIVGSKPKKLFENSILVDHVKKIMLVIN
ncbi:hypothetical protein D3C86_1905280 [compost metagenome]